MRKVLVFLLCLAMVLHICGTVLAYEQDPNLNAAGELPVCKEPITLTVGMPVDACITDLATNRMTEMLSEDLNINFEFVTYAASEMKEKINIMVAGGNQELPDVILFGLMTSGLPSDIAVYNWAMNGALVPLTEYIENASVYLKESAENAGGLDSLLSQITSPDGEVYGLPCYCRALPNDYNTKLWIYQPWLDKLGLTAPTNAEELYQVLKAFKEQDPNGNGKADEIPFASQNSLPYYWRRGLMSLFTNVGDVSNYIAVSDGTLVASYMTEGYREGLRYVNQLISEGLISPLTFTQDNAQLKTLMSQEKTVVGMTIAPSAATLMPTTDQRRAEYVGIAPLAAADGTVTTPINPTKASIAGVITTNCKNPEAAFRFLDLLCSEKYTVMNRWGEEGVDWITPPENTEALYSAMGYSAYLQETGNISFGSGQNQCWHVTGPMVRGYSISAGMCWNGDPLSSEYMIAKIMPEYNGKGPEEYLTKLIYTEEENDQIAEPMTTIKSYVDECFALFATGEMDVDNDWDNYLKELDQMGVEDVLAVMQSVYDRIN